MYLISVGCFSAKSAMLDAALPNTPSRLLMVGSNVAPMFVASTDIWFFNSCKLFSVVADRISNSCCILPMYAVSSETIAIFVFNESKLSISAFIFWLTFSPKISFIACDLCIVDRPLMLSSIASNASLPLPFCTMSV